MKYSKRLAQKICELTATGNHAIVNICKAVGVEKQTFYNWKRDRPEFAALLEEARLEYIDSIKIMARSGLATLIEKTTFTETTVVYGLDKKGQPVKKSETTVTKVIMPNVAAVIYALNNSDPDNFKQRQIIAHTGEDGGPVQTETVIKIGYGKAVDDYNEAVPDNPMKVVLNHVSKN